MIGARAAIERLAEGNRRFLAGRHRLLRDLDDEHRMEQVSGQAPFAIVLGCSDSRVPAEIVFDQGLGDLFVIRVAGNTVFPSQVGSVEFAVSQFSTPLVVVLGHSHCGAVQATLEQVRKTAGQVPPNLATIVNRIRPAVEGLNGVRSREMDDLMGEAVRANVAASVGQLRRGSGIIENLLENGELSVVGAEYSLETGRVDFFDAPLV